MIRSQYLSFLILAKGGVPDWSWFYLVSKTTVVLQDVVLLAANGLGNLLGGGQQVNHLGIGELVQELGMVCQEEKNNVSTIRENKS